MRIRKVKWKNHPILGNLELDFINPTTNRPYTNIVLAGENGTGKTSIMNSIFSFLNSDSFEFEEFEYEPLPGQVFIALPSKTPDRGSFHERLDTGNGEQKAIDYDKVVRNYKLESDIYDPRYYGTSFSKAQSIFLTDRIKATSTLHLDEERYINEDQKDYTKLKQLLVDINSQDSLEYVEINKKRGNTPVPWYEFMPSSRMFRFSHAFITFFDTLSFDRIDASVGGDIRIIFKKNGIDIPVDDLSTEEKQNSISRSLIVEEL